MRRTKMVCTLGPSSSSPEIIRALIRAGMDVARLNFSHGTHETHGQTIAAVRCLAEELGHNVAIMMDLQGPKIRTGPLRGGGPVRLTEGAAICVTTRSAPGDAECVSTTYDRLPNDVKPGDRILVADGAIELRVERVEPPDVHCRVVRGADLGEHKGINLPGVPVSAPALTEKDIADLEFGLGLGVDYVALSYVRAADDIRVIKEQIQQAGKEVAVVAKIERPEALDHFDAILSLADAVMVARGDLGVEVELDEVPRIQKELISKCNRHGVPVITATQMLESMIANPRPTRAEVADVANAIYDGTDAVMLSGETTVGRYPVEAAAMMAQIALKTDRAIATAALPWERRTDWSTPGAFRDSFGEAIGQAVGRIAETLNVARIVCFTMSGYTAAAIARYRPRPPITAITLSEESRRRCALYWGVDAVTSVEVHDTDDMVGVVDGILIQRKLAKQGDTVIIVAGTPLAVRGRTNLLKLHRVGDAT